MTPPEMLFLGEAMVEFVCEDRGDRFRRGFGGDTSNAAIAAARQGGNAGYVSALGADRFGDALMALWEREGVDTRFVRRAPDAPTGIYFVEPHPSGRDFTYYRAGSAASRFGVDDLDLGAMAGARVIHASGITLAVSGALRAAAIAAGRAVRAAGGAVSIDTNLRLSLWNADAARIATHAVAREADVVFTSIDDSRTLTGLDDPAAVADFYLTLGARIVVVTLGGEGSFVADGGEGMHVPPAPSRPVDSTGAGDSFAGAFLAWWVETGDSRLAARRAAIVAAGTVSGFGAVAPIPGRQAVLAAEGSR